MLTFILAVFALLILYPVATLVLWPFYHTKFNENSVAHNITDQAFAKHNARKYRTNQQLLSEALYLANDVNTPLKLWIGSLLAIPLIRHAIKVKAIKDDKAILRYVHKPYVTPRRITSSPPSLFADIVMERKMNKMLQVLEDLKFETFPI